MQTQQEVNLGVFGNNLRYYLRKVAGGEALVITEASGKPMARVVPIIATSPQGDDGGQLAG